MTAPAEIDWPHPPWVLDHAPYAPFTDPRTVGPPGLAPLDMAGWTVRHADHAAQMRRRREVLSDHPEIALAGTSEGEPAEWELLGMLNTHLGDGPRALTLLEKFCPLTAMGNLVAEDFCLLLPDAVSGEYRLVAAVLCFPSGWLLAEKIGRPLTMIHDPVPDYDATLARRVNRIFDRIDPARPLVRVNWTIHPTAELFLPPGISDELMVLEHPEAPIYLRTERQTLVRLPETGAVAFGIKTSITPLECLRPAEARALHDAVRGLHAEKIDYSSGRAVIAAALTILARIGAGTDSS